jgi:50S ribosomal protein L16 3-hydroxylase
VAELAIETTFDWGVFVERYWDRQPVLYKNVRPVPFTQEEVFEAAVRRSRSAHSLVMPDDLQFVIGRQQQIRPHDYLPDAADGSLAGYEQRIARRLDGERYALVIHLFHRSAHAQRLSTQRFYAPLWELVGQPVTTGISAMFHGNYEHSPVGVHMDRFATFMFCVRGRKRMRFWAERPWTEPVQTVVDYQPYLEKSFAAEVETGDLLYWPACYYHVGESAGGEPATSVNVAAPRNEHRVIYELTDMFGEDTPSSGVAPFTFDSDVDGRLSGDLPSALREAAALLQGRLHERCLRERATAAALRIRTSGGFQPVPEPVEVSPPEDTTELRAGARIMTASVGATVLCAANGKELRNHVSDAARAVLRRLAEGAAVRVGELPEVEREQVRGLLRELESIRAVTRDHLG